MQAAEKISITVTSEQLRAVRESVAAGEYASTSEVMRCACGSGSARRMPNAWMPSALASAGRWTIRIPHSRSTKSTLTSNNYLPKRTKPRKTTAVRRLRVELQPEAVADLADIFRVVWQASRNLTTAKGFVRRIRDRCHRIGNAPRGGRRRDDLEPGLRNLPVEHSAVIAYRVEADRVLVTNVLYGGQTFEAPYRDGRPDDDAEATARRPHPSPLQSSFTITPHPRPP